VVLLSNNAIDAATRLLSLNQTAMNKSLERLASGRRINRAGDDAAGLAMVELLSSDIRGSGAALRNVQDAGGMLNIADGALDATSQDLQRIRELTVQASSGTYSQEQRDAMASEIRQLADGIDARAQGTQFNGVPLLDGSANLDIQSGPNAGDTINVTIANGGTDAAAGGNGLFDSGGGATFTDSADLAANFTQANAQAFLGDIDSAIAANNTSRASIGASQNQLDSAAGNLSVSIENTSAARSRIQDVDVASEMVNIMQLKILTQASALVLAQALNLGAGKAKSLLDF